MKIGTPLDMHGPADLGVRPGGTAAVPSPAAASPGVAATDQVAVSDAAVQMGALATGEFDSDTVSGPIAPATNRGRPVSFPTLSAHSRHCRAEVSLISHASFFRNGSSITLW